MSELYVVTLTVQRKMPIANVEEPEELAEAQSGLAKMGWETMDIDAIEPAEPDGDDMEMDDE